MGTAHQNPRTLILNHWWAMPTLLNFLIPNSRYLPDPTGEESWYIMTNLEGNIIKQIGVLDSLRNWIEYAFKQIKNELGWRDFRVTDYASIEKWWEIVMSAYLLVSLQANYFSLGSILNKND